jgi:hypothetical protein
MVGPHCLGKLPTERSVLGLWAGDIGGMDSNASSREGGDDRSGI